MTSSSTDRAAGPVAPPAAGGAVARPVAPPGPAAPARPGPLAAFSRYLPPLFITLILLVGHLTAGILESLTQTLVAIGVAILVELILSRLMVGRWPHLASAYITGISVGILLRSTFVWPFAICSALSIASKYVLRWHGRHLWNPSNFGICAMLFLYPQAVAHLTIQWDNSLWPMLIIWCLGALIIYKARRLHITATYVVSFAVFAFIRSLLPGGAPFLATLAPLTGPMYQLFIFFMITDPKTTVRSVKGQCLVVFLVAFVEMLLRLAEVIHAPFYALFLVGPVAVAIEILRDKRAERRKAVATDDPA